MTRVPPPARAVDPKPPALSLDPVGEAAQAGAAVGCRAADPVVRDLDHELSVLERRRIDADDGVRVLGDVRQRFRGDEVGGRLDLGLQAIELGVDRDRHRRLARQRGESDGEATLSEDPGVDAAGELAELLDRDLDLLGCGGEQPLDVGVGASFRGAAGRSSARAPARRGAAGRRRGGRARFRLCSSPGGDDPRTDSLTLRAGPAPPPGAGRSRVRAAQLRQPPRSARARREAWDRGSEQPAARRRGRAV